RFLHYEDYAKASITDLLTKEQLERSSSVEAKMLQSVYIQNNGNTFSMMPLPLYAQLSAMNGIVALDIDGDGKKDLVISGNLYPFRVQSGPLDASIGLILKGNGKGQ